MPTTIAGAGQSLPTWARAVARHLPRTAAAMLQLDFAQRIQSPIDPVLRAQMRWVIANENRCPYSLAYAEADLKRAGASDSVVERLRKGKQAWNPTEQLPLEFARLLTVDAPSISDELFDRLRLAFGEKQVAAMVLLAAYGNFQDRLMLGLNLAFEPGEPLAPVDVRFADSAFQMAPFVPPSGISNSLIKEGKTVVEIDSDWDDISYEQLQTRLETQRNRKSRLPVPSWEEVQKKLPPAMAVRPTKIVWNLVCSGYVPELAVPWSIATRTLWAELHQDRVFEESLFWIQTRAIGCSYCMGHCEMLLAVAGLDSSEVAERTRRLASHDWSAFPPSEQRAFAFARKLSRTPWELTKSDYQSLETDYGPDKAMAIFWWLCRGLYMTRVSDGFQLPLERENVFQ